MSETLTLAERVRAVLLGAGFNGTDGGLTGIRFRVTEGVGVTVGTEARGDAPESVRRAMLGRYAAVLRESGMTVSDRRERGHVYVHEEGQGDPAVSNPVIQYFASSGTWVKPPGAVRVDVVLAGGDGGNATESGGSSFPGEGGGNSHIGYVPNPNAHASYAGVRGSASGGDPGTLSVSSFDAADLPDTVEVEVGKGGRPGGRDGYALVVTHLREES